MNKEESYLKKISLFLPQMHLQIDRIIIELGDGTLKKVI